MRDKRYRKAKKEMVHFVPLSQKEMEQIYKDTKIIVDYTAQTQSGFTMRTIESIGYRCKLITNNMNIMDADFYNVRTALGEILSRDNTEVHFFQNEQEIITNLDNYKDYTHFKPSINSWMSKEIDKKSHLLNRKDYENTLNQFYKYVSQFNYDAFYNQYI